MQTSSYKLTLTITDVELSVLLNALDAHRNDYQNELKKVRKEFKRGQIIKATRKTCNRFYRQAIAATESLEAKIDKATPSDTQPKRERAYWQARARA